MVGKRRTRRHRGGDSNTKWAIVQYDDRPLKDVDKGLMNRNNHYAKKWNHDYIFKKDGYEDMPPYWRKVFLVKDILESGKYRGALWLDTDAMVYNMETDLNTLVEEGKHFYKSRDATPQNGGFCAGVWFVLNTPTGKEILSKWAEKYNPSVWVKNKNRPGVPSKNQENPWRTNGIWAGSNYEQGSFIQHIIPTYNNVLKEYPDNYLQSTDPHKDAFILHFYFTLGLREVVLKENPLPMILSIGGGRKRKRVTRRKQRGGKPPPVVFHFGAICGFGSLVNVMIQAYIYAKEEGRDFYLHDSTWDGGPMSRWHDGFKTLTTYNPDEHGTERHECGHPKYGEMKEYSLSKFNEAVKELFVFNDDIAAKAKEFTDSIGGPYTSVYIRRGDKITGCKSAAPEMELIRTPELLKVFAIPDDGRKIFVMSDDYTVIEELQKELPSCKMFTLIPETNRGLTQDMIRGFKPEERKAQLDEFLISMQVFLNGEKAWADNRSNLGRLLKIANVDKVNLYPISEHSKSLTGDTPIWPSWRELGLPLK